MTMPSSENRYIAFLESPNHRKEIENIDNVKEDV